MGTEINEKIWINKNTLCSGTDVKNILLGCPETRQWRPAFQRKMAGCECRDSCTK
jgi:hypothetical protein